MPDEPGMARGYVVDVVGDVMDDGGRWWSPSGMRSVVSERESRTAWLIERFSKRA